MSTITPTDDLFKAIQENDLPALDRLLRSDPALARARNAQGVSAILFALYYRRPEALQALLAAGPALDVFEAAALGRSERIAELIGEDPERAVAWSPDGFTPLHLAAFFGHVETVQLLLEHGAPADPEARNPMRVRPLHSAAAGHHIEACRVLVAVGADVDARQQAGWTAIHQAAHSGDRELLELLLAHGADPNVRNDDGTTPLQLAEKDGQAEIAERLRGLL